MTKKLILFSFSLFLFCGLPNKILAEETNFKSNKINSENNTWLTELNNKIQKDPTNTENYINRASYYNSIDKFELAIKDYNKVIALNPKHSGAYYCRGYSYRRLGKYELAIESFNKSLLYDSSLENMENAYTDRGKAYMFQGNYLQALKDLGNAIWINPENIEAYDTRGLIYTYYLKDSKDLAIKDYSKIIEIDDENNISAYSSRASLYEDLGKYDSAIKDYSKIIELEAEDKELIDAYYNRSSIYIKQGKLELAIQDLTELIKLKPEKKELLNAYNDRADAYRKVKKYQESLIDYKMVKEIDPSNTLVSYDIYETLNEYGEVLVKSGKTKEGDEKLKEALQIQNTFPKNKTVSEADIAIIEAGLSYEKEPEKAISILNNISKKTSLNDDTKVILAVAYINLSIPKLNSNNFNSVISNLESAKKVLDEIKIKPEKTKKIETELHNVLKRIYLWNGGLYMHQHKYTDSLNEVNKLLVFDSQNAEAYNIKGYSEFRLGKKNEGIFSLLKSIKLNPKDPWSYYNLACVYALDNNLPLAFKFLETSIKINNKVKDFALQDKDFVRLKQNKTFIKITN